MSNEKISDEEAAKEVELVSKRLALLHLSYAKTLVEELGEEKGRSLALKAIKRYGTHIGKERRKEIEQKGLEPTAENFAKGNAFRIPKFGMHADLESTEEGIKLYGCALGKLWREMGEEELGRIYCYVDPAKYLGYNEDIVQIHQKAMPAGDSHCQFEVRESTEDEKKLFRSEIKDFFEIDKRLKK